MRQKITDVAIELMKKEDWIDIGYESFGLLDEVFSECLKRGIVKEIGSRGGGKRNPHPINHHQVVMNALDRDEKRFEKYFIKCCGGREDYECTVRMFELRKEYRL